jgi:hypothetical protein
MALRRLLIVFKPLARLQEWLNSGYSSTGRGKNDTCMQIHQKATHLDQQAALLDMQCRQALLGAPNWTPWHGA